MGKTMKLPRIYAQAVRKLPIDMTLSENPLGCSPMVMNAIKTLSPRDVVEYPNDRRLISAIARMFKRNKKEILVGSGSEQLIKLITQTFLKQNDCALIQQGSFSLFTKECFLAGASVRAFNPLKNSRVNSNINLIFICTPNNPTGEILPESVVARILASARCPVIIDEANAEFTNKSFVLSAVSSGKGIILRTFSKAFGLAGLRVGVAIGPEKLLARLRIAQQPFPVSSIACKLVLSALCDSTFVIKTRRYINSERARLSEELRKRGFQVSASRTNTLFVQSRTQTDIVQKLAQQGVSVVDGSFFPFMKTRGFRMALRDKKTNTKFLRALDKALSCTGK
jgi:histidinol-phosphate/aromatic aminotransferase/cobyric acid decarboxylase-like protein